MKPRPSSSVPGSGSRGRRPRGTAPASLPITPGSSNATSGSATPARPPRRRNFARWRRKPSEVASMQREAWAVLLILLLAGGAAYVHVTTPPRSTAAATSAGTAPRDSPQRRSATSLPARPSSSSRPKRSATCRRFSMAAAGSSSPTRTGTQTASLSGAPPSPGYGQEASEAAAREESAPGTRSTYRKGSCRNGMKTLIIWFLNQTMHAEVLRQAEAAG